jgi:hypothetical protein
MYGRCGTEAGMQTGSVSRKIPSKSFPPMRMDACLVTEFILPLIRTRVFCIQAVLLQNTQTNMKMLYIWGFLRLLTENHFMWSHHFTPKELEAKKKNCVHAKAGRSLKEDEIIFYSEAAMVMNYLVEFDA